MLSKIIRIQEVTTRTGLSRPTIWRKIRTGEFPKSFPIGKHSVGWLESDITKWIEDCAKQVGVGHFDSPNSDDSSQSADRKGDKFYGRK